MRDVPNAAYASANMFIVSTETTGDTLDTVGSVDVLYASSYDYSGPSDPVNLVAITVSA